MSLKILLMPLISRRQLSLQHLLARRARAERQRMARGEDHVLHYFHQVDDPYSALLLQALPTLLARYRVKLQAHIVPEPSAAAAPERARLVAYSRSDAQALARHWGLNFDDPGRQPEPATTEAVTVALVGAVERGDFLQDAPSLSAAYWQNLRLPAAPAAKPTPTTEQVRQHLAESDALRAGLGHYLGAMVYYAGEWYWGIDRLHHLESRLQDLGLTSGDALHQHALFPLVPDFQPSQSATRRSTIDFFVSLRSPYSAIATPRIFDMAKAMGADVRLRYVLPMVMRGLPVPTPKRSYIAADAAREAQVRGIAFGCINDPVGSPTERGLAVLDLADRTGRGEALLRSFMHGVWAEGVNAGSDRGLRQITERAGLSWSETVEALHNDQWRATAQANRQALFDGGLWGVPSFQVNGVAVWGQDRLWAVRDALLQPAVNAPLSV